MNVDHDTAPDARSEPSVEKAPSLSLEAGPGETLDSICGGKVQVLQRTDGYRFNLDPLLLAHFAAAAPPVVRGGHTPGATMDLGTGSGILALLFARRFGFTRVMALELQQGLFDLAVRNVRLNGCEGDVSIVHGDLRYAESLFAPGSFERVVSNPPYRPVLHGRVSPQPERALARHELECDVTDVVRAARHLLVPGGVVTLVFPASRLVELLGVLRSDRLEPRRLCFVHPLADRPAKLLLVDAVKAGRGELQVLPPLVLHGEAGAFSPDVQAMVDGRDVPRPDFA